MMVAVLVAIVAFVADHKTILMAEGRLVVIVAAGPHKTIVAPVELPVAVVVAVYRTAAVAVVAYQRIVVVEFQMAVGGRSLVVAEAIDAAPIAGKIHMTSVAAVVAAVDFSMVAMVERRSPLGMAARARSIAATAGPLWSSHYLTMMFPQ